MKILDTFLWALMYGLFVSVFLLATGWVNVEIPWAFARGNSVETVQTVRYTCPMHPQFVTSDPNARCPECGMSLVPVGSVSADGCEMKCCSGEEASSDECETPAGEAPGEESEKIENSEENSGDV